MTHEFTNISNATMMSLNTRAQSDVAMSMATKISRRLQKQEQRKRKRKQKDQQVFELGVDLILADLLYSLRNKDSDWVYHSLSRNSFSDEPIGANTFLLIIELLKKEGLVEARKGGNLKNHFYEPGTTAKRYYPGMATRFKPSERLVSYAAKFGINADSYNSHYKTQMPRNSLRLRAAKSGRSSQFQRGKQMRVELTPAAQQIKTQVDELNAFLGGHSLKGGEFFGYIRVFNEGDRADFQWNRGGRLYAVGEGSYQQMSKADRRKLKIDGKPVVEIDINASFLRIYHGLLREPLPNRRDLYKIPGVPREVVKAWVTATFGNRQFHTTWPRGLKASLESKGIAISRDLSMSKVQQLVFKHIPAFTLWNAESYSWSTLMHHESEQLIKTMEQLRDQFNVPSYSVHDSLIVPRDFKDQATQLLKSNFELAFAVPFRFS
jgi:hypothetical protein